MNDVAYLSGLVVAAVLAWAGVAKLGTPDLVAARFRDVGLGAASGVLAVVVPPVELVVAVALVTVPSIGGLAAAALLSLFSIVLVRVAGRDEPIGCACFGGTGDRPVGTTDLVRNAALVVASLLATTATPVTPSFPAVVIVSIITGAALLAATLADLRREVGTLWISPDDVRDRW